jgi:hypothetical protein
MSLNFLRFSCFIIILMYMISALSRYFLCDCLNFVNVIGQMYFVDKFLGGVFMTYGTEVLNFANTDDADRTDPMMTVSENNLFKFL